MCGPGTPSSSAEIRAVQDAESGVICGVLASAEFLAPRERQVIPAGDAKHIVGSIEQSRGVEQSIARSSRSGRGHERSCLWPQYHAANYLGLNFSRHTLIEVAGLRTGDFKLYLSGYPATSR